MTRKELKAHITAAETFGMIHFAKGGACIPANCPDVATPPAGATTKEYCAIMKGFYAGWTRANLAAAFA